MFPKMLSQNCKDYSQENTMYNKDPDKAGTARMFLSKMIENENTNVYSLEVSMFGYKPNKKTDKVIPYTEENCELSELLFDLFSCQQQTVSSIQLFQTFYKAAVFVELSGTITRSQATLKDVRY